VVLDWCNGDRMASLTAENAFEVLHAAEKYELPGLCGECVSVIKGALSAANALDFYFKAKRIVPIDEVVEMCR